MSIIDKVVAAVTPPESEDARRDARTKAMAAAPAGTWLSMVLKHHQDIEAAFAAVKTATTPAAQVAAQKKLATLLTGHSVAEEAALYPALAGAGEKGHARYQEEFTRYVGANVEIADVRKQAVMS